MNHDDDFHEFSDLPEAEPEITLEAVEELSRSVIRALDVLEHELHAVDQNQEYQWASRVQAAKPKDTGKEYIVGIIGATGVGKSALMNAILGEESLLPTSCMQACTATIIEVAYNRSTSHEYRATVEFISRESWDDEICKLFRLTSDSTEDLDDATSEAAIAFAKVSAVHPDLNRKSLPMFTEDDFLSRPGPDCLGTSRRIGAPSAWVMNAELQKYVETKEKAEMSFNAHQADPSQHMEYWPLVRKVRIFVKASALRTGVVLTDLPGVADANPARSSIAINYLPNCASIWVVAPVLRAIDDKIARDLGSENLKRHLRRDGILNRVVFICSKADQLSIPELKRKFLSDNTFKSRMHKIEMEKQNLTNKKKEIKKDIARLEKILQSGVNQIKSFEFEYNAYTKLLSMAKDGRAVYPPIPRRLKRANTGQEFPSQKRPKLGTLVLYDPVRSMARSGSVDSNDLDLDDAYEEQDLGTTHVEQDFTQPAMTPIGIQKKVDKTGEQLHELRTKLEDPKINLDSQKRELEDLEKLVSSLAIQEWEECYTARNEYVSRHLRSDFQLGIRDLERAEMEADGHFDPDEEVIDSFEKQTDVPVFFTSSQAFQKLMGRLEDEPLSGKFTNTSQTGIPDLVRDCIKIGEKEILATRATSANLITQLLNSVRFWLGEHGDVVVYSLPGSQTVQKNTEQLHKEITGTFERTFAKIVSETNHLNGALVQGAKVGEAQAMGIVRTWRTMVHHNTYRAVVRHEGIFRKPGYVINWKEELIRPMMRCVDYRWNRVTNEAIPSALSDAKERCLCLVDNYLTKLEKIDEFSFASVQTRNGWRAQSGRLKIELEQMWNQVRQVLFQDKVKAFHVFLEGFSSTLKILFSNLPKDSGKGVCERTQERIESKMLVIKGRIFGEAVRKVIYALEVSLNKSKESLSQSLRIAFDKLQHDCKSLFRKRAHGYCRVSEMHRIRILRSIGDIEGVIGNQADRGSWNDGRDHVVPRTTRTKHEPSSQSKRGISPTGYSTVSSNESPEWNGKDEDDWSVVGSVYD